MVVAVVVVEVVWVRLRISFSFSSGLSISIGRSLSIMKMPGVAAIVGVAVVVVVSVGETITSVASVAMAIRDMSMIVEAAVAIAKAIEPVLGRCSLSISLRLSYSFRLCLGLTGGKTDGNEAKSGDCLGRRIFAVNLRKEQLTYQRPDHCVFRDWIRTETQVAPLPLLYPVGQQQVEAKLTWTRTSLDQERNPASCFVSLTSNGPNYLLRKTLLSVTERNKKN